MKESADIEHLFERARGDIEADRVARVRQRLEPVFSAPSRPWLRWGALGGGVVLVIVALAWWRRPKESHSDDVRAPVPVVQPSQNEPPVVTAPRTTEEAPSPTTTVVAKPLVTVPAPIQDPIVAEHALLARARKALDSDPQTTLTLVDEHARKFPHGTLESEREFLRISALVRLGRTDEARAARDRFIRAWPTSAYRDRIESMTR